MGNREFQTVTLPSGRLVDMRVPGALEHWYCTELLPDLGKLSEQHAAGVEPKSTDIRADRRAAILLCCECMEKPKLWADLRGAHERASEPMACPAGFEPFDLSLPDFAHLSDWLQKRILEAAAAVRPTSPTEEG